MKTVKTKDYFGKEKNFIICFETSVLHETFSVGIDTTKPNEVSFFHVTNDKTKDNYTCLSTYFYFYDAYQKYNVSFEDDFKKEIKNYLKKTLVQRVEAGTLTIAQVKKLAE